MTLKMNHHPTLRVTFLYNLFTLLTRCFPKNQLGDKRCGDTAHQRRMHTDEHYFCSKRKDIFWTDLLNRGGKCDPACYCNSQAHFFAPLGLINSLMINAQPALLNARVRIRQQVCNRELEFTLVVKHVSIL